MFRKTPALVLCLLYTAPPGPCVAKTDRSEKAGEATETIEVTLKPLTGGGVTGLVVDHNDHGIVIVHDHTPFVFAWDELDTQSAFRAKHALLALARGGPDNLTAGDHLALGRFVLARGRNGQAAVLFRKAEAMDPALAGAIKDALDAFRAANETRREAKATRPVHDDDGSVGGTTSAAAAPSVDEDLSALSESPVVGTSPEIQDKAREVYMALGERVRQAVAKDIVLIETDHFLIWTDWRKRQRARLADLCESMYRALCAQFDFDPERSVFLWKCPVFCWRTKGRFRRFAQRIDGYDGVNAIGYTRSIEKNGHVHLVLLRNGTSQADFDRFACTLVHEGTHAFLHRYHTTRLIPHWINEGLADLMAERVLGDRCPNAENADLLARQYVRYDWPIGDLLAHSGPIAVHQYPLAHSVVAYLVSQDKAAFAELIRSLKEGAALADAVAQNYGGMELASLEEAWRSDVRRRLDLDKR